MKLEMSKNKFCRIVVKLPNLQNKNDLDVCRTDCHLIISTEDKNKTHIANSFSTKLYHEDFFSF